MRDRDQRDREIVAELETTEHSRLLKKTGHLWMGDLFCGAVWKKP